MVNYFTSFTFILDFKNGGLGVEGEGGGGRKPVTLENPQMPKILGVGPSNWYSVYLVNVPFWKQMVFSTLDFF